MYSTAALTSASEACEPPRGGMAPLPLMAMASMLSMPCSIKGAQAALSPNLGAPATPAAWQAKQTDLYSFSPAGSMAAVSAAAAAGLAAGAAAAGAAGAADRTSVV